MGKSRKGMLWNTFLSLLLFCLFFIQSFYLILGDSECSRPISRKISHAIQLLFREDKKITRLMSPECPLTPEMHIYNKEESNRIVFPSGENQCGFCGRIFKGEKAYDEHIAEAHNSSQEEEFICLQKFCGFFGYCEENTTRMICEGGRDSPLINEISDICTRVISSCFQTNKESKLVGTELRKRLCLKEKILMVNGCFENENIEKASSSLFGLALSQFPRLLLVAIIIGTTVISYKVNEYVNKIK